MEIDLEIDQARAARLNARIYQDVVWYLYMSMYIVSISVNIWLMVEYYDDSIGFELMLIWTILRFVYCIIDFFLDNYISKLILIEDREVRIHKNMLIGLLRDIPKMTIYLALSIESLILVRDNSLPNEIVIAIYVYIGFGFARSLLSCLTGCAECTYFVCKYLDVQTYKLPNKIFTTFSHKQYDAIKSNLTYEQPTCIICIGDYEDADIVTKLPCEHIYHHDCIKPWFNNHTTCPQCRADFMPMDPNMSGHV